MFKNVNWKVLVRRVVEVVLAALIGGTGTYLSLVDESPPDNVQITLAISPESFG